MAIIYGSSKCRPGSVGKWYGFLGRGGSAPKIVDELKNIFQLQ